MFTIALIGQKGVTGKTTAAIGLAVEASRNRWDVVLVDLDQQATAANWKDCRNRDEGHINRLKVIKRQMYGRGGFELWKARVLPWTLPAAG